VEAGQMTMKAALALANLPEDLQPKFLDDAITMDTNEFCVRAKAALRDFKAYLLRVQQDEKQLGAVIPKLRAVNVLKRESITPKYSENVLKKSKAKTPADGWNACMSWIFGIDPVSVERRINNRKDEEHATQMSAAEYRKANREMIKKFVKPTSKTGDYRNGN